MKIQGPPLVKASYDELVSFVRYYRHHGTPIIIGGWAVWFHNPYFGSIDIDVVGPSYRGEFYRIIEEYEHTHGYQTTPTDLLGVEAVASKPIIHKGKKAGDMEIDACSFEQTGASEFHEDRSLTLPYSLCDEPGNKREVKIARDCICYAPSKALLIMFKIKAHRDRSYDIKVKGGSMNPERLVWLKTKVAKDSTDIIALLDPRKRPSLIMDRLDYAKLGQIAKARGLEHLAAETLGGVLGSREASMSYGRTLNLKVLKVSISSVFPSFKVGPD